LTRKFCLDIFSQLKSLDSSGRQQSGISCLKKFFLTPVPAGGCRLVPVSAEKGALPFSAADFMPIFQNCKLFDMTV